MIISKSAPNGGEAFGASKSTRSGADSQNYNAGKDAFTAASRWTDAVDNGLKSSAYKNLLKIIWITLSAEWGGRGHGQ